MRIWTTTRRWYGLVKRCWGALRARLRREGAALALLTLLTLGLGEPLLCIMHCQIWLPLAYHNHFAAQHQHAHHGHHAQHGTSGSALAAAAPAVESALERPSIITAKNAKNAKVQEYDASPRSSRSLRSSRLEFLTGALVLSPAPANDPGCMMPRVSGSTNGVPFHVPPSSVHDALPVLLALFFAALLLHIRPAAPPGDPPPLAWPPPLRPPILLAH